MSVTIYVIDTSYLLELFGCPHVSNASASTKVRALFKSANASGARFFVPLPCLFELGNHIADVKKDDLRSQLVNRLVEAVEGSLSENKPWTITPTGPPDSVLPSLMQKYAPMAGQKKIGLVDSFTLMEALRLKESLKSYKARVHIWTNDRMLKSCEPDPEDNPYFW